MVSPNKNIENKEEIAVETAENQAEVNISNEEGKVELPEDEGANTYIVKERDEWKDKAYRLAAEMENLKRRTAKEVDDARKYGVTSFARELLTVQDNLERALTAMQDAEVAKEILDPMLEGMKMVSDQLSKSFDKAQIKRIESIGQKADPELHQVMMEIPDEAAEAGTIVQEMQAGYTIADRLLRPALVGTAKKA